MVKPLGGRVLRSLLLVVLSVAVLSACAPAPRKALTEEQKQADLMWLYSQFTENYAPLDYKQTSLGIKFEDLKANYLKDASKTTSNEEFYRLMSRFVSEFHDAHTKTNQNFSVLPKRNYIAYLGFGGIRLGDGFLVLALLPSFHNNRYPVKIGDIITKMDGKALTDLAKALECDRLTGDVLT